MKLAITGTSGSMGRPTLRFVMEIKDVTLCKILLLNDRKSRHYGKKMKNLYGDRLEVIFGDIRTYSDCLKLTKDVDYVLHLAAIIPPTADHDEELTISTNYNGTKNMVDATIENGNTAKFIHISTVALYGNRDFKHPWGRVGDPLLVSAFDVYGTSKLRAERYLLESKLNNWVVLRQSGILHENMLMNNISDGLMFHTPWNVPIEWVTDKDSGLLMKNILLRDLNREVDSFWKNIYNIGGGIGCRQTGYETFNSGFEIIGGNCKSFFKPNWNARRNFHCFWYSDSDALDDLFHFRTQSCDKFWEDFTKQHRIYKLGKIVPLALIRAMVIKPLLKNSNAPMYWKKSKQEDRVFAIFGDEAVSEKWDEFDLKCEEKDYHELKIHNSSLDLNHGYNENKELIDIDDLKSAAEYRGGSLISKEFNPGDIYKSVRWKCSCQKEFDATPFVVLKGGHWCPYCSTPDREWNFDKLAKTNKFYAQVWYDTHKRDEDKVYKVGSKQI